jgi:hypothetical protein
MIEFAPSIIGQNKIVAGALVFIELRNYSMESAKVVKNVWINLSIVLAGSAENSLRTLLATIAFKARQ